MALTIGDELREIRARLKALHREVKPHTAWLGIAAAELDDALKELPRAVLTKSLKAGLEPASGAAPAASKGGARRAPPEAAGTPAAPAVSTKGEPAAGTNGVHTAPPPAAAAPVRRVYRCGKCGEAGHTAKRHDAVVAAREGETAAQPDETPASDDESDPAPQPAPRAAEDEQTPSPGRGELLDDQRGGAADDPPAPPPSAAPRVLRCSICSAVGHNARGHHAHVVATSAPVLEQEPEPTFAPPPPVATETKAPRRRKACKVCGETGHNRTFHDPKKPKPKAKPGRQVDGPDVDPEAPSAVAAGQRFMVSEDFIEEERPVAWLAGDVWTAVSPTGVEVDGYAEWLMRSQDGDEQTGHPQLTPFFPCGASRGESLERVRAAG